MSTFIKPRYVVTAIFESIFALTLLEASLTTYIEARKASFKLR